MPLDMGKYLGLFVSEAGDHLDDLSDSLVRLEKAGRERAETVPILDGMFRHAHSVKGMAASMQFDGIASLAHRVEDLLGNLRKSPGPVHADVVDALLVAVDELQAMVKAAAAGTPPPPMPALIERLGRAIELVRSGAGQGAGKSGSDPTLSPGKGEDRSGEAQPRSADRPPSGEARPAAPAAPPSGGEKDSKPPVPASPRVRFSVEVEISGACPVPAVRGFLVLKKLGGLGTVVRSSPTSEDLRAGRIPGKRLSVVLETSEAPQALERALSQISDLASVAIRAVEEQAAPVVVQRPEEATAEASRTVRVRTEILDHFLDAVGELILATSRLRDLGRRVPPEHRPPLDEGIDRLHSIVKDLHDKVMAVRMTPIALVTDRLPRTARDLARKLAKQVDVTVTGAGIEIDRAILEQLSDPLLHVLRNAVDHGIEPPHLRLLAGKPATGQITVSARRERDRVLLEIADDGKGMDPAKLRSAAVARGALSAEAVAELSDRDALMLACLPGVSTAETVTDISGRGVGMDAVKKAVESVGGTLEIESALGAGARLTFRLPLTVAVQPVLLVRVGEEVVGLPIAKVHGATEVNLQQLETSRGNPILAYEGGQVIVHDLARLLGIHGSPRPTCSVVVAEGDGGRIGLAVDALLGQEEAVLKPLHDPLDRVPGLSAVTVLGSGRPVFILDVPRLLAA